MVPATSIFTGNGEKWRNTVFDAQKHVYKRGVNDGSEFQTSVPETPALPTVRISLLGVSGSVPRTHRGSIPCASYSFSLSGLSVPCASSGSTFFIHQKPDGSRVKIPFGPWGIAVGSVFGPACTDTEEYMECGYAESGYFEGDCGTPPTCTYDYVECEYMEDDYVL
jgi:hypothetical protein